MPRISFSDEPNFDAKPQQSPGQQKRHNRPMLLNARCAQQHRSQTTGTDNVDCQDSMWEIWKYRGMNAPIAGQCSVSAWPATKQHKHKAPNNRGVSRPELESQYIWQPTICSLFSLYTFQVAEEGTRFNLLPSLILVRRATLEKD